MHIHVCICMYVCIYLSIYICISMRRREVQSGEGASSGNTIRAPLAFTVRCSPAACNSHLRLIDVSLNYRLESN